MNALLDKKLRISDVAYAAQTTPKSLMNWLQREQVRLTTFADSGWREFNLADVAILTLVRQMVDFGVPVEKSSDIANTVIIGYGVSYDPTASTCAGALRFAGAQLLVWREANEWKMRMIVPGKERTPLPDAYVSIALSPVVGSAIERALLGSEGDDWADYGESMKAGLQKLILTIQDATPSKEGGEK
jgi:hypothetical protein